MSGLVLSLFSGVGALDHAFREAGWCVVSAGDVAWSNLYDVRDFHAPAGVFEGVIGGDPCQSHSALANLVRAKGLEPSFPDMTPEFQRVVDEARPRWFLRENTPMAPHIAPAGYAVSTFLLDHARLDQGDGTSPEQLRRRRFWFGVRGAERVELRHFIPLAVDDGALFGVPHEKALSVDAGHDKLDGAERIARYREKVPAVSSNANSDAINHGEAARARKLGKVQGITADQRAVPVALGGSGKPKAAATSCDGRRGHRGDAPDKRAAATGRHHGEIGVTGGHAGNPPRYSLDEMIALQGLPADMFAHCPLTVQGKRKFVGNAVPVTMGRALARAVRLALG